MNRLGLKKKSPRRKADRIMERLNNWLNIHEDIKDKKNLRIKTLKEVLL